MIELISSSVIMCDNNTLPNFRLIIKDFPQSQI